MVRRVSSTAPSRSTAGRDGQSGQMIVRIRAIKIGVGCIVDKLDAPVAEVIVVLADEIAPNLKMRGLELGIIERSSVIAFNPPQAR